MSRLEELINELCPGGVEYKSLKELCTEIIVPMRDRPKVFDGDIPWCRIEDKEGRYFNKSLSGLAVSHRVVDEMNLKVFPTGTVICSCSASLGSYAINTQPLITNQTFIGLVCGDDLFNEYLCYYMETQTDYIKSQASTGTIPYVSRKKFEEMRIPVPPIEIQEEIVKTLDKFTDYVTELQAELQARKQQFEYYRDNILKGNEETQSIRMEEICELITKGTTPKQFSKEGVNFIKTEAFVGNAIDLSRLSYVDYDTHTDFLKRSILAENDILLTIAGATIGKSAIVPKEVLPANTNQALAIIRLKSSVSVKYVFHILQSNIMKKYIKTKVKGSAQPNLTLKLISDFEIPLPSIKKQIELVEILDKYDSLCNDIASGLPAEIEARQKQYEYYRDKLLTFKELPKEA